jgi:hypothetical protein
VLLDLSLLAQYHKVYLASKLLVSRKKRLKKREKKRQWATRTKIKKEASFKPNL